MKALKIIVIILLVLFGAYCIWMATLPSEYKVERSTVIDAPPAQVYAVVSDFKTWEDWDPWNRRDSTIEHEFGETSQGVGAMYSWTSKNSGAGTQEIIAAEENKSMETKLVFEGMGDSHTHWTFEEVPEGKTKVTWDLTGETSFFGRWQSAMMDQFVGKDYEDGLENLKQKVESMPALETEYEIVMTDATPVEYYYVEDKVSFEELNSEFFATRYQELGQYLGEDAQNMNGAPFAVYHEWNEETQMADIAVALPITSAKPGNDRVKKGEIAAGKVLKVVYMGPYEGTGEVHYAIDQYMEKNNIQMAGSPWEVYVTDPGSEPDSSKWITEVYYPVTVVEMEASNMEESTGGGNG